MLVLACVAGPPAPAQVLTTWNPLYTVGDWDWYVYLNPTPFWLHVPFSVAGIGVGPEQGIPPDNGEWQFIVTIPTGDINLSTFKTITALLVDGDARLLIETGTLTSLTTVTNASEVELNAAATLITPLFENLPLAELHLTSASQLIGATLDNQGTVTADTGAIMTVATINNHADGTIIVDPGGLVLASGLVNNDGEIRIDTQGAELLATLSSLTLTGSGLLVLDHDAAALVSLATINNLGNHTIRGKGSVLAGVLTNSSDIRADETNDLLNIIAGSLDNSGRLLALGLGELRIQASGIGNSGLIEARQGSRIDIDAGSLDNSDTNPTPDVSPLAPAGAGTGIRAIDASTIRIENAAIDNDAGLIEARGDALVQVEDVSLHGGLLFADDSSLLQVAGYQSTMRDFRLDGLLQVLPGGHLNLYGTIDNLAGTIEVQPGGHVDFEYGSFVTLIGGAITGGGTLAKEIFTALTLDARTGMLLEDVRLVVYHGNYLRPLGELTNNATIETRGEAGFQTVVRIDGEVAFDGHGALLFGPGDQTFVNAGTADAVLTNRAAHTIASLGPSTSAQISVELVNHGTVDADGGFINLASASVRNDGLLQSSSGGTLHIGDGTPTNMVDNSGGIIAAQAGSLTQLVNLHVLDGELAGAGLIQIAGTGTLQSTQMHITGNVQVPSSQRLYLQGEFVNDGLLYLSDHEPGSGMFGSLQAFMYAAGEVVLDGGGVLGFATPNNGNLLAPDPVNGGSILQRAGHTIATVGQDGAGSISTDLISYGTVDANDGRLSILTASVVNRGLLLASNGGELTIGSQSAATLDNAGGVIRAGAGSLVQFINEIVSGGLLEGEGTIVPAATMFDSSTDPMLLDGNVYIDYVHRLTLRGVFVNDGQLRLNDTHSNSAAGFNPYLLIDGTVVVGGAGDIRFTSPHQGTIDDTAATGRLVQLADHAIRTVGAGSRGFIDVDFDNAGLIESDNGILQVRSLDNVNTGTIRALNGGWVGLSGFSPAVLNNAGGTLLVDDTSTFLLGNLALQGGQLAGPGYFTVQGLVSFDGTTAAGPIVADANTYIGWNGTLTLDGDFTNNGRMLIVDPDYGGGRALLRISGATTVGGSGVIEYSGGNENHIQPAGSTGTDRLIVGAQQAIRALGATTAGNLSVNFTNHGQILVDDATLHVTSTAMANDGALRAVNGATLYLSAFTPAVLDNSGGTLFVDSTSTFLLGNLNLQGGRLDGDGHFVVQGPVTYDGTTAAGPVLADAGTYVGWNGLLTLRGELTNNGRILLVDPDYGGPRARLLISGEVEVGGSGAIEYHSANENYIQPAGTTGTDRLIVGAQQAIRALGASTVADLQVNLSNRGEVLVDDGTLRVQSANIVNDGAIRAINGASLWLSHNTGAVIDNGGGLIEADATSTIYTSGVTIQGGRLAGDGYFVVQGNATWDSTTAAGRVSVDANTYVGWAGSLFLKGQVVDNGLLRIADPDAGGPRSRVYVTGETRLDGTGTITFEGGRNNELLPNGTGARLTVGPEFSLSAPNGGLGYLAVPIVLEGTLGEDGGNYTFAGSIVNNGLMRSSNGSDMQIYNPIGGSGSWLADNAALRFYHNITTTGDITVRNGAGLQNPGVVLTGDDFSVLDGSGISFTNATVRLTGDFSFDIADPAHWTWTGTTVLEMLAGEPGIAMLSAPGMDWSLLEIGGRDYGLDPDNHVGAPEGFVNSNFWLPKLVIGPGAAVALADLFDNGHRGGPHGSAEALYVGQLVFGDASSILDLRGLNLYYQSLTGISAQIVSTPLPPQWPLAGLLAGWLLLRSRPGARVTHKA